MCNFAYCRGLRYFVAKQFLSQIYALLSVKFPGLKICECKNKLAKLRRHKSGTIRKNTLWINTLLENTFFENTL